MTPALQNILSFIDKYYPVPVLRTYTPSDYDMEYKFYTPRKLKKLPEYTEKMNQKYKEEYDRELEKRNSVIKVVKEIECMPTSLVNLFYSTLKDQVLNDIKIRNYSKEIEEEFKKMCGITGKEVTIGRDHLYYFSKELFSKHVRISTDNGYQLTLKDDSKNLLVKYPILVNMDLKEFEILYRKNEEYKRKANQSMQPIECLRWGAFKLTEILDQMKRVLGNLPDMCECGAHWGVGGEFNGIIGYNEKRASFKSFLAGGWNIQRLHIRCKITLLKSVQ